MYGHLTESIDRSAAGPHIAALFNLDRTLLVGSSELALLPPRLLRRTMTPPELPAMSATMSNLHP